MKGVQNENDGKKSLHVIRRNGKTADMIVQCRALYGTVRRQRHVEGNSRWRAKPMKTDERLRL